MARTDLLQYDASKYPVISSFIQDWDHKVIGIKGPFGSGKSVSCVMKILSAASMIPPCRDGIRRSRWAIIRNTTPQLRDTTIKTWLEWVPENIFGIFKRQERQHLVKFNDVELEVLFRALDDDKDVRNLLSFELTGAWVNEAREIPWVIIKNLRGRLKRYPRLDEWGKDKAKWAYPGDNPYWSGIIMDTNPCDEEHWWYKFAVDPEGACVNDNGLVDRKMLKDLTTAFKFYDQPGGLDPGAENLDNLSPTYYTDMMVGADPEWIRIHVHGLYGYILEGKPVYPEYHDTAHCKPTTVIPNIPMIRSWDFGLTPACVFFQIDPKGRVLIHDELFSEDMGIDRFSDVVLQHSRQHYGSMKFEDYGDPAGTQRAQTDEKTCFQIMWNKGIGIEKGRQDLKIRIESVKKALNSMVEGAPALQLDPKCKLLRAGFNGKYCWKKIGVSGAAKYSDKPDKNKHSHIHDALQYGCSVLYGASLIDPFFSFNPEDEEDEDREVNIVKRNRCTGY